MFEARGEVGHFFVWVGRPLDSGCLGGRWRHTGIMYHKIGLWHHGQWQDGRSSQVCNWVLVIYVHTTVQPYSFSVPTYSFFRKNQFFRRNRWSIEKQFLRNLKHLRFIFQRQCIPKKAMNS